MSIKPDLHTIELVEPSDELFLRISKRTREEKLRLRFRRRIVFALAGFLGSLVGFLAAVMWFVIGSSVTGFTEVASLLASDSGFVLRNWQDYSMSLLETLPVINAVALLALLFCTIWSAMMLAGNVKNIRTLGRAMNH